MSGQSEKKKGIIMSKLNIAFTGNVFPFGEGFAYGGERILYYLIRELSKLGHNIYLFSREGTNVPSKYIKDYVPIGELQNDVDLHYEAVVEYVNRTKTEFDIYMCNYFGDGWNPDVIDNFNYVELVWCVWCHIRWNMNKLPFNTITYSRVLQQDFARLGLPTSMIHYGIPKEDYVPCYEPDDYAVWIGKIEGGKAPHLAIETAKKAGMKIVIMGPPYNSGCFWEKVYPYIDNKDVFWVRGVDDAMKQKIMSMAKVFISSNDNTWKEHFGIVNAESLAMGTPVLAFNKRNQDCAVVVDQIVKDMKTGFILNYMDSNNVDEITSDGANMLKNLKYIDRRDCRKEFEERFTSELMAKRYDWFFDKVKEGERFNTVEVPF